MPAGRPRKYADNAERQAAYNERLREAARIEETRRQCRIQTRNMRANAAQDEAANAVKERIKELILTKTHPDYVDYMQQIQKHLAGRKLRIQIDLT